MLTDIAEHCSKIPSSYILNQNYPNPFNPVTNISWQLAVTSEVDLSIYNILGKKVYTLVSEKQAPGKYSIEWNASHFTSGIYYYLIKVGEFKDVKKAFTQSMTGTPTVVEVI